MTATGTGNGPTGNGTTDAAGAGTTGPSAGETGGDGPEAWVSELFRLYRAMQDEPPGTTECRYCPLCQAVALLRRSGPDLLDRVSDVAAGLAATLRASETGSAPDMSSQAAPRPAEPERTERIDVTD